MDEFEYERLSMEMMVDANDDVSSMMTDEVYLESEMIGIVQ